MDFVTSDEQIFPIGVAARMLKISVHTIRLYERSGLIILKKNESGRRMLSKWDIERIRCIRKMIIEEKLNIGGIKKILSMQPCWIMFSECKKEIYESCPAYTTSEGPCWSLADRPKICANKDCYSCPIYRGPYFCDKIKDSIKEHIKD